MTLAGMHRSTIFCMANQGTSNETPAKLELADATLSLWRGCKFVVGAQQFTTGARVNVRDKLTSADEDVAIIGIGPQATVKRLVLQIEITTGRISYSFAELDAADHKRLLTLYKMFDRKS
jgi:hypothetical protein